MLPRLSRPRTVRSEDFAERHVEEAVEASDGPRVEASRDSLMRNVLRSRPRPRCRYRSNRNLSACTPAPRARRLESFLRMAQPVARGSLSTAWGWRHPPRLRHGVTSLPFKQNSPVTRICGVPGPCCFQTAARSVQRDPRRDRATDLQVRAERSSNGAPVGSRPWCALSRRRTIGRGTTRGAGRAGDRLGDLSMTAMDSNSRYFGGHGPRTPYFIRANRRRGLPSEIASLSDFERPAALSRASGSMSAGGNE